MSLFLLSFFFSLKVILSLLTRSTRSSSPTEVCGVSTDPYCLNDDVGGGEEERVGEEGNDPGDDVVDDDVDDVDVSSDRIDD